MKSQALILQFIVFFVIGLAIFIGIAQAYRLRVFTYREDLASEWRGLLSSYFDSVAVWLSSCKECDFLTYKFRVENVSVGYFTQLLLDEKGSMVVTLPGGEYFSSPLHNLNASFQLSGEALSTRPIKITLSREENKLEVS